MSEEAKEAPTGLALLREPFAENQISKMCRSTKKDNPKAKCPACGGWHGMPAIQISYVGHAALTDRLLSADPTWQWEPLAMGANGLPALDANGGMWIKLTVCGVTRLGYGDAQARMGGDGVKEIIGDALRNAAMRFGAALDLWHKGGDLHADDDRVEADPEGKTALEACASMQSLAKAWAALTKEQRETLADVKNECKERITKADKEAA